jgi:hypothetical protein
MCLLSRTIARILRGLSAALSAGSGEISTERRRVDSRCPSGESRDGRIASAFAGLLALGARAPVIAAERP